VIRTMDSLRRRNVIKGYQEHTAGSFAVQLERVSRLAEAPRRRREKSGRPEVPTPESLQSLPEECRTLLRNLAERALEGLGIKDTMPFMQGEMLKQFAAVARGVPEGPDRDERLAAALRVAMEQYE
jgi:hypothetical protein